MQEISFLLQFAFRLHFRSHSVLLKGCRLNHSSHLRWHLNRFHLFAPPSILCYSDHLPRRKRVYAGVENELSDE